MSQPSPPPEDGRLYTYRDAVTLGRRALCETGDGHRIVTTHQARNANSAVAYRSYGCECCDVVVTLEYPALRDT